MSDLKTRLLDCADLWSAAHADAPVSRIGKAVAGDANLLKRLRDGGGLNLGTLENAARFLADPANWPDGDVPEMVRDFAHVTGVSVADGAASTGHAGDVSGVERAA